VGREGTHRVRVGIGGNGDPVLRGADVDAGGVEVYRLECGRESLLGGGTGA